MIENSMFEEEPDVVDLAKESSSYPIDSDDVMYEPRSSRLLVRGLGENELDEDEEDYESSARLLGMSFMNRSSNQRTATSYTRHQSSGTCSKPSVKTMAAGVFVLALVTSLAMVIYFLPSCTFSKGGCQKANTSQDVIYPIASNGDLFPWTDLRLPVSVTPVHYTVALHPNLTTMTFRGSVNITLQVLQETDRVILHSADMNIDKATFQGKKVTILRYTDWQQIAIKFPENLTKGKEYALYIEYSANFSTSYDGFYNSSYTDTTGEKRYF